LTCLTIWITRATSEASGVSVMVLAVGYVAQDMKVRNFGSWVKVRFLKGWMLEQQKMEDIVDLRILRRKV
jgi:hypothetical protein